MTTLYAVELPYKLAWTHSALARTLKIDRKTVRQYVEKVATAVPDYRRELPRIGNTLIYKMPLTPYQAWVVGQLIFKGQELRAEIKGLPIHSIVYDWAATNFEVLSKQSWNVLENAQVS